MSYESENTLGSLSIIDRKDQFEQEYLEEKELYEEKEKEEEEKELNLLGDYLYQPLDKNGNVITSFVFTDWKEYVDAYIIGHSGVYHFVENHEIKISCSCERIDYIYNAVYDFAKKWYYTSDDNTNQAEYNLFVKDMNRIYDAFNISRGLNFLFQNYKEFTTHVLYDIAWRLDCSNVIGNPIKLKYNIGKMLYSEDSIQFYQKLADEISPYYILFFQNLPEYFRGDNEYESDSDGIKKKKDTQKYLKFNLTIKQMEKYVSLKDIGKIVKKYRFNESFYKKYINALLDKVQELEDDFEEAISPDGIIFSVCKKRFESNQSK